MWLEHQSLQGAKKSIELLDDGQLGSDGGSSFARGGHWLLPQLFQANTQLVPTCAPDPGLQLPVETAVRSGSQPFLGCQ